MWPFKKREAKYSEIGQRLYCLLKYDRGWVIGEGGRPYHIGSGVSLDSFTSLESWRFSRVVCVWVANRSKFAGLTVDDHARLAPLVVSLREVLQRDEYEDQKAGDLAAVKKAVGL